MVHLLFLDRDCPPEVFPIQPSAISLIFIIEKEIGTGRIPPVPEDHFLSDDLLEDFSRP
jgi:hypothetical protein